MYHKFGLATYPTKFKGTVVSPTKICLQFSEVDVKLRTLGEDAKMLPKDPLTHQPVASISTESEPFSVLAVGCQMPVVISLMEQLIMALETYSHAHIPTYRTTYGRDLKTDLSKVKNEFIRVLDGMS